MPQVGMPEIGTSFYQPSMSFPSRPAEKTEIQTDATTSAGKSDSAAVSVAGSQPSASSEKRLTDTLSLFSGNDTLTAADITSLSEAGLFGNLSSLSGVSFSSPSVSSSDKILSEILVSLEELKKVQNDASPAEKSELSDIQDDSRNFSMRRPAVLRFKVNGFNVADSIRETFFSEPDSDGSFLFTGDRSYYADGKNRSETFYILFKAVRSSGGSVTYEVVPSLVQDYVNENSLLYKVAAAGKFSAEKTGNLVSLYSSEPDRNFSMNILLDIDAGKS